MPKFIDVHNDLTLPPEAIEKFAQETRDGTTDEFGVRQVELYYNDGGKAVCVLDGPDKDAVKKHHEALGVSVGDIDEVKSLL